MLVNKHGVLYHRLDKQTVIIVDEAHNVAQNSLSWT